MRIVLAPDSFKGSLASIQVCEAMEQGIRKITPEAKVIYVPMADGGEGTVEAVIAATGGRIIRIPVKDPLGREIEGFFGLTGDGETAVIEMAAASGLPLLNDYERNPLIASTYGTGELIKAALDRNSKRIILGIGGSATNDGGMGMAKALGAKFLDSYGNELPEGGAALNNLNRIDLSKLDPRVKTTEISVACDVTNPLCGPTGAAAVYGLQKGATPEMVEILDRGLKNIADIVHDQLSFAINDLPGAGAAGGLGGGLVAFLGAKLTSGINLVIEATGLKYKLQNSLLLFTGEGRLDYQSTFGKTISGVGEAALAAGVPVIVVAGSLGEGYEQIYEVGVVGVTSIVSRPMTLSEALDDASNLVADATARCLKLYLAGKTI